MLLWCLYSTSACTTIPKSKQAIAENSTVLGPQDGEKSPILGRLVATFKPTAELGSSDASIWIEGQRMNEVVSAKKKLRAFLKPQPSRERERHGIVHHTVEGGRKARSSLCSCMLPWCVESNPCCSQTSSCLGGPHSSVFQGELQLYVYNISMPKSQHVTHVTNNICEIQQFRLLWHETFHRRVKCFEN